MKKKYVYVTLGVILLAGLLGLAYFFFFKTKPNDTRQAIAKVYETSLYEADLEGLVPKGTSRKDSTDLVNRYVESWIRKQLMLAKAESEVKADEPELERKMLDYRYALLVYELEKKYIAEKLDTNVSEVEIEEYYQKNQADFMLRQPIVQAWQVVVPEKTKKIGEIRNLMRSADFQNKKKLTDLAEQLAINFSLNDSLWVELDDLIKNTPFQGIPNKVQFLKQNVYAEQSQSNQTYLLRILAYKISDQPS
ncbi:MAG: peptidyl-prolyl cis-trans isomerase, partial [Verrucomicrobia bacterium]|nr:peptidyl-prolyl cis-trans isomerase [Cytophagales bacterium]